MALGAVRIISICALCGGALTTLVACGGEDSQPQSSSVAPAPPNPASASTLPTVADLNAVLAQTWDTTVPDEVKAQAVEGGENAVEVFKPLVKAKQESGAHFTVVEPVLPGVVPNTVLATVEFSRPERPTQITDNVDFVYQDGRWKLSKDWACVVVTNTLRSNQIPADCQQPSPSATGQ